MTVDEDDHVREERIEAFRCDHKMTDDDLLIVRVIHPPARPEYTEQKQKRQIQSGMS